jgi:hypothetical protein
VTLVTMALVAQIALGVSIGGLTIAFVWLLVRCYLRRGVAAPVTGHDNQLHPPLWSDGRADLRHPALRLARHVLHLIGS